MKTIAIAVLTDSRGNMTKAAALLGMSRNALYAACKRWNVNPDSFRPAERATGAFVIEPDVDVDGLPEVDAELLDN